MNKEWDEMCGEEYPPNSVIDEPKNHRVAEAGEAHPPIGGRGGQRRRGSGYPYVEDNEVGADLRGILVSSDSGIP